MDFIGIRYLDFESPDYRLILKASLDIKLYDQRHRNPYKEMRIMSALTGLNSEVNLKSDQQFKPVANFDDEIEVIMSIYNAYFAIEPEYIRMTNNMWCKQRKESFDEWVQSKLLFSKLSRVSLPKHAIGCIPLSNINDVGALTRLADYLNIPLKSFEIYLNNFLSIPQVNKSRDLCQFPIPVIDEGLHSKQLTENWLLLLSWGVKVFKYICPLTLKLKLLYDRDKSRARSVTKLKKAEKVINELRLVLTDCKEQGEELFQSGTLGRIPQYQPRESVVDLGTVSLDIEDEYETEKYKVSQTIKDRDLVEDLLLFSVVIAQLTVTYLKTIQNLQFSHQEYDTHHRETLAQEIRILNGKLRNSYKRKADKVTLVVIDDFVKRLISSIGVSLKDINKRISRETKANLGPVMEFEQDVRNVHDIMLAVMDRAGTEVLDVIYKYYKMKMKKEFVEMVMKQYFHQLTYFCTKKILVNYGPSTVYLKQVVDVHDRLSIIAPNSYNTLLSIIERSMKGSISVVKTTVVKKEDGHDLNNSFIYEDLPKFLKHFPDIFFICPHPILDIDGFSESRLRRIKSELFKEFEENFSQMEEVLRLADEYVKFNVHLNK